jgi:NAD(P)-dependent dehydrogenase (short-subunit alcohol dehydrogenase family)
MSITDRKPVWFITGCSTGFGREIARHTLELGYPTVVTARNQDQISDIVLGNEDHSLALKLDVTDTKQIAASVKAAIDKFGRIDVLVNNAGIGYFGSFEESSLDEVRRMFEINFWGLAEITRSVLPELRKQRSGTIVNISSIGGIAAFPSLSFYNATKFAVEALSESLSAEVAPLGIKVLVVEPGPFRTDWAGRSANEAPTTIADYRETAGVRTAMIRSYSGNQPGDPVRAAKAIVKAVEAPNPPLRLLLGKPAQGLARGKLESLRKDFEDWAELAASADFPSPN